MTPAEQAVLDAALADIEEAAKALKQWDLIGPGSWVSDAEWAHQEIDAILAAVAVYRASLNDTPCPRCRGEKGYWGSAQGDPNNPDLPIPAIGVWYPCSACGGSGVTPNPRPHDPFDDGTTIYSEPLNASKPLGRP
jgi:hypothetical protein